MAHSKQLLPHKYKLQWHPPHSHPFPMLLFGKFILDDAVNNSWAGWNIFQVVQNQEPQIFCTL